MKTNPKLTLPTFRPEHAYRVLERLIELKYTVVPREQWDRAVHLWGKGKAWTLMADGMIVGCGGMMMQDRGKGEAWVIATPLISKYRKSVYKVIRNMLGMMTKEYKLRRVEALCPCGYERGRRLLEHLGFVNETPDGMKQYGPGGETYYLYGRVTK
jgi:hypothetical protein